MSKTTKSFAQTVKRVKQLHKDGVSFRKIEARMPKALGLSKPGNGTAAYRIISANA